MKDSYIYNELLFKYLLCANNTVILALIFKYSKFRDEWYENSLDYYCFLLSCVLTLLGSLINTIAIFKINRFNEV